MNGELSLKDQQHFLTAFQTPSDRAKATYDLAAFKAAALPLLCRILDGTSKNEWGVAHRKIGIVVDCALVTVRNLGPIAKSLEDLVRAEAATGHPYAAEALAAIGAQQTVQPVEPASGGSAS